MSASNKQLGLQSPNISTWTRKDQQMLANMTHETE